MVGSWEKRGVAAAKGDGIHGRLLSTPSFLPETIF